MSDQEFRRNAAAVLTISAFYLLPGESLARGLQSLRDARLTPSRPADKLRLAARGTSGAFRSGPR